MIISALEGDTKLIVLDIDRALCDVGGDRELLSELAGFFAEDAPKICDELATATNQQSWDRAVKLAHSLKNMASQFRAEPTTSLAASLENLLRLKARDEVTPQCLNSVAGSVSGMIAALRAEELLS